ncbi:exonuclease SbcCD subunit D [Janibacter sp. DB-40]|uniref:exonuclease SbcCD subunit D n=1 Tax=Janibacter sp. DB-40 TaxID=3028808 RepID=UPI002405FAEE|nr:exonuclease SbcCD subunit D [Janibacter sp. DB-40]
MKLLHTSDWHLGRAFHGVGLLAAQSEFVDHLVATVRAESVDAVLVSGDVYDRALPPPDAVSLLSEAVTRIIDSGARVIISSGNHDSAIRLGFASDLLSRAGLHIRSDLDSIGTPVMVGDTAVYPIPYLEPAASSVTEELGVDQRTHTSVLGAAMDRVRADAATRGPRTIAMAHCFASGGATSESERDISTGGVAVVPTSTFDGVAYAALGHLHGAQQVAETVRYSGSPVAMSFSETHHTKGTLLLDLGAEGDVRVERVEAPVHRRLAQVRGTLQEVLTDPGHAPAEGAWVQVTLTDPVRPVGAMEQLARRFPHVLQLRFDPQGESLPARSYAAKVARREPLEVCCDFVEDVRRGAGADEAETRLLRDALEAGRAARGRREDEGRARERGAA